MNNWPAEWAPQSALMLTWPRPEGDFGTHLADVERCYCELVAVVSAYQPVIITAASPEQRSRILEQLPADAHLERVSVYLSPSNDVWARDHGPIGVSTPDGPQLLKFRFDGWGGKYPADLDNRIVWQLASQGAFGRTPICDCSLTLEGGAIESNGEGVLLATRRSVLDPKRNPNARQSDIEAQLRTLLGVHTFHWLDSGGIAGDDTDGHIDTLARFVAPDHIVYQASGGPNDPNHADLDAMLGELQRLRRPDGGSYRLTALPAPPLRTDEEGTLLPAGYANFVIINGAVIVPTYGDTDRDVEAMAVLRECFPDREVLGVDAQPLIRQFGSIHCVTMTIPEL